VAAKGSSQVYLRKTIPFGRLTGVYSPGKFWLSLTHSPGLGSGTLEVRTGSQAEEDVACSLNLPLKAACGEMGSLGLGIAIESVEQHALT